MLKVPSPLAEATLAFMDADQALHEAYLSGDQTLIDKKRAEWLAAYRRRRELTEPCGRF
jgi:hypothetical protein